MPIILDPLPPDPPTPLPDTGTGTASLITSEHNQQPRFMATVAAVLSPIEAVTQLLQQLPTDFDLDTAVGAQLDVLGLWLGRSRHVPTELEGVYFSWGTAGLGWGQGTWLGPNDSPTGLTTLPDDSYRDLLRFRIAQNRWDGTVSQAIEMLNTLFVGTDVMVLFQDNGDMTMAVALLGVDASAVLRALFKNGFLDLKPAGVGLDRLVPSVPGTPLFGWGTENGSIAGWGQGSWATAP